MDNSTQQQSQNQNNTPQDGHQDGKHDDHQHPGEGIPKDLKMVGTGKVVFAGALFAGLLVLLFLVGYIPHHHNETTIQKETADAQNELPVVNVMTPKRQDAGSDLVLPGDVRPLQQTSLYPRANGFLKKLYVDIGDTVKDGQLLAEIDTPEVDAQLAQSQATVQASQANIAKAQNDYDLAKTTLDRYQNFAKSGGVTQQDLDTRTNAFTQAKATLEAQKAALASANADVTRLQAIQGFQKVVAPFAGTITARGFDVGALLSSSSTTPMFALAETDTLRVFVNVPQSYATLVKVGQEANLAVANYPNKTFTGKVTRSSDSLDPATRTIKFQVDFPNKDGALFAGMYGQIIFHLKPDQPPVTVPTSALVFNAQGLRVATVDGEGKIKFKVISVGRDFGTDVEIATGLATNDQVVTNPGERLQDGVKVKLNQPQQAAAPAGGPATKPTAEAAAR